MNKYKILVVVYIITTLFSTSQLRAQERLIQGIVSDVKGETLPGVTVVEKGTVNGVTTDEHGHYSIKVGDNAILVFSSISYVTVEKSIGKLTELNIVMKDDMLMLNEAVVTGYGQTVSKDKLTAAISKVSSKEISRGSHSNLLRSIAGNVTGVRISSTTGQPGSSPSIIIRGGAALNGTGTPLYIVDGVQKNSLSDINSNDIESVDILKDAAATALYGARANAGVVLISTKKGREGKSVITFKLRTGVSHLPNTDEFLSADDYLYYMRLAAYRSGNIAALSASGPYGIGNLLEADGNKSPDGVYSPMFLNEKNNYLLEEGYKQMIDPITAKPIIYQEFSSRDASVRDVAITQDYNVAASGGNDRSKYYAGFGYYKEEGFPIVSGYDRLSFTGNSSYKINSWITNETGLSFSRGNQKNVGDYIGGGEKNFFGIMYSAPPTMRKYNPLGDLIVCTTNWENGNWDAAKDRFYRRRTNYRLTLNEQLKLSINKHLSFKIKGAWFLNVTEVEKANKAYLYRPGVINKDRRVSNSYGRRLDQTYNALLVYNNMWRGHSLNIIAGYEYIDQCRYGLFASGQGADSDDFISLGYFDKTEKKNISQINMNSTHLREKSMSFFANIMYDWKERYLFSISSRYDGYSKLVNNKWGFFPGISAAWNVHKEPFMNLTKQWLSSLKIRAGFGQNGNVNILAGPYDLQGNYGKTGSYDGTYGILINKLAYPDLKWEKTTSFDLAAESVLFNRLNLSIGVYSKLTSNLLASVPYPSSSGVGNQYTNNGSVRNRGIEFEIHGNIFKNDSWSISAGLNATYMKSKIISLPYNGKLNNRQGGTQVYNRSDGQLEWVGGYQEGKEFGVAYAYKMIDIVRTNEDLEKFAWYKDEVPSSGTIYGPAIWNTLTEEEQKKGQPLKLGDAIFYDVNGDQVIDKYDQVYMGNLVPRVVGGLNFMISYKNLSLYTKFDYAADYVGINSRKQWYMGLYQGTFNTLKLSKDTWSEQRPNAKYPILMYADNKNRNNYRMSDIFYDESSYLCARNVTLSYRLPNRISEKFKMTAAEFSITGQNIFYLTKSSRYSPEYGVNPNGGYGTPCMILFGINISF